MMKKNWFSQWIFLVLIGLLITGCSESQTEIPALTPSPTSIMSGIPLSTALPLPVSETSAASTGSSILNLQFPTPAAPPVSKWRPPLNDIPLALNPQDHFFFKRPIAADEVNWPLPDYRYGGTFFGVEFIHTGIDIDAARGAPVLAAAPGEVVWAGYGLYYGNNSPNDPYGLAVTIRHNFGYKGKYLYTVYAHMDEVSAVTGQWVNTGDPIGLVGNTGNTTGPHLHFEVRLEENSFFWTRNPELWLAPPEGMGVLAGTLRNTNGSYLTGEAVHVINRKTKQKWVIYSYGGTTVRSDDYYKENLVLSDLPAGEYEISIDYLSNNYFINTEIHPGTVTYFTFRGAKGYSLDPPATPSPDEWLTTPTPKKK